MNEAPLILALAAPEWLVSWVTTLWLISVGTAIGLLLCLVLFAIRPRNGSSFFSVIGEGILLPIVTLMGLVALFSIPGGFIVKEPGKMFESMARIMSTGTSATEYEVPAKADSFEVPINLRGDEALNFQLVADTLMDIQFGDSAVGDSELGVEVGPSQPFNWKRRQQVRLFGGRTVDNLYVTNLRDRPGKLLVAVTTGPAFPEVSVVPVVAIGVFGIVAFYFVQAWYFPRVSAIALATTKSELAQPLFGILTAVGLFLLILFMFLPYNTFGEDIKMLKDSGLTLVMILGIVQGVWAASNSVADEIEGRTALTVLSKPVSRRQFLLGKLSGILWTVLLMFLILGAMLVIVVAYKPVYDAREMGSETPLWGISHLEVTLTVPGLLLAFFEAIVLVSISVALSTRLPMLANFVICFTIYVLGHITPLLVQSEITFAPVVFIGQFIATILPVLDHFNIQAAVAAGKQVPWVYLGWAFLYSMMYSAIAMLLALVLFEDKDLA